MSLEIRWFCVTMGLALAFAGQMAQAQDVDPSAPTDECVPHPEGKGSLCGHAAAQMMRLQLERLSPEDENAPDTTDITHCHLEIEIDPVAKTLAGSNTIDVIARSSGLSQFKLDLQSNMAVDSATVNGANAVFTRPADQILITLDRAYNPGETFQVTVVYHGTPLAYSWGYFQFGTHGSGTVVASGMSEPWFAHLWWPCKESLTDKFTADIWVTTPGWMVVASNGSLQGTDDLSGDRKRYRWQESYPIAVYLVAVAATNYTKQTATYTYSGGSMPVECYVYPESATAGRILASSLVSMITTFSQPNIFGQYPFINEKYGTVQDNWGGGMENQTLTSQSPDIGEAVTAHELSHQWWGDMITCKTWHDIWLNEGFATYSEAIWDERKPGGSLSAYHGHFTTVSAGSYPGTVYCYDISSVNNIFSSYSYHKGAWVLHMLRHVIGDAAFFDTLAAYRAAFAGGAADTEDFRSVAEGVSCRDLSWFFNQWVYQGGVPTYRYGWKQVQIDNQKWVQLCVEQTQTANPAFTMPIDVALTGSGLATQVIWNQASRQWYLLPAGAGATALTLDKDVWILRSATSSTTYVDGPPKLIHAQPSPGDRLDARASIGSVQVQFSEPVNCTVADFIVTGSRSGPQPFTLSYSSLNYTATLTFPQPLANAQTWTVCVLDTARSVAVGAALDGELATSDNPAGLPSGDGLPGGNSVFGFCVAVPGDFDRDGDIDVADLGVFRACLSGPAVAYADECVKADLDHDGDVDQVDFGIFQRCYSGATKPADPNCAN